MIFSIYEVLWHRVEFKEISHLDSEEMGESQLYFIMRSTVIGSVISISVIHELLRNCNNVINYCRSVNSHDGNAEADVEQTSLQTRDGKPATIVEHTSLQLRCWRMESTSSARRNALRNFKIMHLI